MHLHQVHDYLIPSFNRGRHLRVFWASSKLGKLVNRPGN